MGERDEVLRRQSTRTKFKNSDMDFALNWALGVSQVIGMGPGEVLAAIKSLRWAGRCRPRRSERTIQRKDTA